MNKKHRLTLAISGSLVLVVALSTYAGIRSGWFSSNASQVTPPSTFTNQATVSYCTQGDATNICNPATNLFPNTGTSNAVITTLVVSTPSPPAATSPSPNQGGASSACFKFTLAKPVANTQVLITVRNGSTQVAQFKTTYDPNGITVTDPTFLAALSSTSYNTLVKADGHLAKSIVGNPVAGCVQASSTVAWGDLQGSTTGGGGTIVGDNVIGPADIVTAIRGRTQNIYTPSDIVTVIHNYVSSSHGDQ